jgi:hypothetical protein
MSLKQKQTSLFSATNKMCVCVRVCARVLCNKTELKNLSLQQTQK